MCKLWKGSEEEMKQMSLDNTGKMILDATCSYARVWPKHATIRIDIRPQTKPDIVMDATELKFSDNYLMRFIVIHLT